MFCANIWSSFEPFLCLDLRSSSYNIYDEENGLKASDCPYTDTRLTPKGKIGTVIPCLAKFCTNEEWYRKKYTV